MDNFVARCAVFSGQPVQLLFLLLLLCKHIQRVEGNSSCQRRPRIRIFLLFIIVHSERIWWNKERKTLRHICGGKRDARYKTGEKRKHTVYSCDTLPCVLALSCDALQVLPEPSLLHCVSQPSCLSSARFFRDLLICPVFFGGQDPCPFKMSRPCPVPSVTVPWDKTRDTVYSFFNNSASLRPILMKLSEY